MWIVPALIPVCRRAHLFCFILSMPVNLQQYRGEIGAFYNRFSKITFVRYCYKFNNILMCLLLLIFSCVALYVVIFINTLKNCTGSMLKLSIISLHLLMANKVNWSSKKKKSKNSRQIHLFLASFRKLLLSWSRLKL